MAGTAADPSANSSTPPRIPGLAKLVTAGPPKNRTILLRCCSGTAKTIMSSHFLVNVILRYEDPGVYVSLDENNVHVFEETLDFGWEFEDLESNNQLIFLEASPVR